MIKILRVAFRGTKLESGAKIQETLAEKGDYNHKKIAFALKFEKLI